MCADYERGHIFTDRLLNLRGEKLTMFMGSNTIKNIIFKLDEDTEFINKERFNEIGKWDKKIFLFFEETEFCYRAKKRKLYCYQINSIKTKSYGLWLGGILG